jgi:peptidylprolyl isomerase
VTVLASAQAEDWRRPDPENLLCLDFAKGRVVIELLPILAPRHVANVKAMVREGYFDGLAIVRVQDNYVVQWGDPNAEDKAKAKPIRTAQPHLPAELEFRLPASTVFHPLPDGDLYAPQAGFLDGMPVARDPKTGLCWPIHSYGMVGAGRDNALDSGGGAEMYVVSGQAPRHLDRNVTLFGHVIQRQTKSQAIKARWRRWLASCDHGVQKHNVGNGACDGPCGVARAGDWHDALLRPAQCCRSESHQTA